MESSSADNDRKRPVEKKILGKISLRDWDVDPSELIDKALSKDMTWTTALQQTQTTR